MQQEQRKQKHQRNADLESVLNEINDIAETGASDQRTQWTDTPIYPPLFLVGCARSGSTLFMQWLAASQEFAYPSNLTSRLYRCPKMGALLHRAFIDLDAREEITSADQRTVNYESLLGKTRGAAQPNEFWYLWRRFFRFGDIQQLSDKQLEQVDTARFVHELAEFESVFDKPIALKALIVNWNLDFLHAVFPTALFAFVHRNAARNALSLLKARKEFFGDESVWYSFKPPEYEWLADLNPVEQVAGQVLATESAIRQGLKKIPQSNVLEIAYEDFCHDPKSVWSRFQHFYQSAQHPFQLGNYSGPESFPTRTTTDPQLELIETAIKNLRPKFK